ncbi:MAG: hypothetical protein WKG07_14030 [Hymenobacter sp.]
MPGLAGRAGVPAGSRPGLGPDVYFSQAFANRQADNPAWTGLVDDYSATLSYRNQFPQLAGSFQTVQPGGGLAAAPAWLHHALGIVINQDHGRHRGLHPPRGHCAVRLPPRLTRHAGPERRPRVGYGRQRVGYDNLTFGDQYGADGQLCRGHGRAPGTASCPLTTSRWG